MTTTIATARPEASAPDAAEAHAQGPVSATSVAVTLCRTRHPHGRAAQLATNGSWDPCRYCTDLATALAGQVTITSEAHPLDSDRDDVTSEPLTEPLTEQLAGLLWQLEMPLDHADGWSFYDLRDDLVEEYRDAAQAVLDDYGVQRRRPQSTGPAGDSLVSLEQVLRVVERELVQQGLRDSVAKVVRAVRDSLRT